MANELPYFRFTVQSWQNGKISLESFELKGLFIDICGYYWIQDCDITLAMLQKKFSNAKGIIELVNLGIIKHENRHDKVEIEFLNLQYDLLSEKRKLRQQAGSKGGNAKAMLKQKGSYKDKDNNKDKDKDNIEQRKLKFASTLEPFLTIYGRELLNDFYRYWTQPNKSQTKFKQELEKTWSLDLRLQTWAKNDKKFKPPETGGKLEKALSINQELTEQIKKRYESTNNNG